MKDVGRGIREKGLGVFLGRLGMTGEEAEMRCPGLGRRGEG